MTRTPPLDAIPVRLVAEAAEERLDLFLARSLGLTRATAQRLIAEGGVRLQERAARASTRLVAGETVVVALPRSRPATLAPERRPLRIVYEDADLLAIDKPAGLTVHPGAGRQSGTLANALVGLGVDLRGSQEPERFVERARMDLGLGSGEGPLCASLRIFSQCDGALEEGGCGGQPPA